MCHTLGSQVNGVRNCAINPCANLWASVSPFVKSSGKVGNLSVQLYL